MNDRGAMLVARECTYHDFIKCQPLNFKGTQGVVRLIKWFKKMETVFHISNGLEKYEVKYVMCTLLKSALTWWNSHKRTIRVDAAFAMSWGELMKLMTEMVPEEEDRVEKFIGGLPDNILGNRTHETPGCYPDYQQFDGSEIEGDTIGVTAQNCRNKTRNKINEARGKAYVLGGGDANPNSNVVSGTFLLNKPYASMLFDSGADRSFVSSTFSALLDVIYSTLDVSYASN
ncbi:hypothetical protein Tco_0349202 [Tanacetum coccineum]